MKLKLSIALIAGIITLNFTDAKAQTTQPVASSSTLKAAEEMLIASGGKDTFAKSIDAAMSQFSTQIPEEKRAKFGEVMKAFINKYVSWETMKAELCQIYAHEFTEAELKQLTVFYKSPLGQKLQLKTPLIMQTGMAIGQKAVAEHQSELQTMMMEAFK